MDEHRRRESRVEVGSASPIPEHERELARMARPEGAHTHQDLRDDLASGEVAREAQRSGSAKVAGKGTPDLTRHAQGHPRMAHRPWHVHRLDRNRVRGQRQRKLVRTVRRRMPRRNPGQLGAQPRDLGERATSERRTIVMPAPRPLQLGENSLARTRDACGTSSSWKPPGVTRSTLAPAGAARARVPIGAM